MKPTIAVPESHRDLLERPVHAVLATMFASGFPQAQPVWCGFDGTHVLVSTTRERAKGRNMTARPWATILVVDPDDTSRWIEIRGDVEITTEGAVELADRLTRAYTRHEHYYGGVFPAEQQQRETRVVCRIRPTRVNLDAIHR
jgi:PPOX class probable F420-dependent enzyme